MKTFLKIVAGVVAFVVVVVVAAVIVFPLVINPKDFKPRIEHMVKEKTGRTLTIPGDIELSVFPRIALDMGSARLGNAPGFGDKPFAQIKEARVRVELWPLIHGRLQVDRVVLDGLRVHLVKKAGGKTNWKGLLSRAKQSKPSTGSASTQPKKKKQTGQENSGGQLNALHVGSLEIRNAAFTYRDTGKDKRYELQKVHLQIDDLGVGKPFPLKLSFRLTTSKPAVTADVRVTGKVTANPGE